ncbi:hypothetical protein SLEP1_g54484 [Rubroshorea leprosula]|uniref:OTU domain-containing protein n=1 Tax=Rubroshorea leprosula TaxID=152421 RepID=A0AAV5MCQ1_9ROSI|nr:hypothetical protein SLEP1_g54484 [Rubroshorea leprosula]
MFSSFAFHFLILYHLSSFQLKDHHSLYEGYVPMKYKRYYKKMAKSGEWGDHVTLQAAADKVCYSFHK